jgi:hypothetical protein
MKKNMGYTDKKIRITAAIAIAILYYLNILSGNFGLVLLVLSVIFVLTSLISFCPLYWPFGISTCRKEKQS